MVPPLWVWCMYQPARKKSEYLPETNHITFFIDDDKLLKKYKKKEDKISLIIDKKLIAK